jgi:O-antigen ligase
MAFFFLLLYITAIYIRPQEWVPVFYAWPLIDILAILTAFSLLFKISQTRKLLLTTPQCLLLFGFLASIVLSHLSHTYFWGAYDSFLKFSRLVIMFLLFINVLDSERKLKIILWFIVILTVTIAIQGIYQFQSGFGWAGQPLTESRRITWIGVFNDANDLALALVMAIGFLMAFVFGKTKILYKIISFSLFALLLYSLYLTNSRGGYMALAGTIMFYFLRRFKNKIIGIPIGVVLVLTLFILGPSRLSMMSASEESASGRIDAWYQGVQMLKSSPLFGVGYGMFTADYPRTAHNSYVLVAAEEGLVGLFFWIALIYSCFKGLDILKKKKPKLINYSAGIEASLFGFLSASFFLSRSYQAILYVMLALASSFIYTFLKKEDYSFNSKDLRIAGVLSLTILFITWITMRVSVRMGG